MTQERLSFCLILASYREQVDKRKLVEVATKFFSKMHIAFPLKNRYFHRKFIESAAQGTQQ